MGLNFNDYSGLQQKGNCVHISVTKCKSDFKHSIKSPKSQNTKMYLSQCSRINHYPNFIAQDFFHFSSFIHNGDNLNMYENLSFHGEFLRKLKNC